MQHISEYLITKNRKLLTGQPEFGCTVDKLKEWFIKLGVKDYEIFEYNGNPNHPEPGEITLTIGPCTSASNSHWIFVETTLENLKTQRVCIRTKIESFFLGASGNSTPIDFETALRIGEYMINNRKAKINLNDFKND